VVQFWWCLDVFCEPPNRALPQDFLAQCLQPSFEQ
jgi:hypothetical protein